MAFPSVVTTNTTNGSTATTTPSINMPSGIVAGDLLIVLFRTAVGSSGVAWPGDWTELVESSADASDDATAIGYKQAAGGDTLTLTTASAKFAAIAWRISGAEAPATQAPQVSTAVTGTSATPDPGSLSPTGGAKDYLWLWMGGWEGEQTSPPATPDPTNYTLNKLGADSGVGGAIATNCRVAAIGRTNNAASEDPGSWTISVSDDWTAWTLAVHPATPRPFVITDIPDPRRRKRRPAETDPLGLLSTTLAPPSRPFVITDIPDTRPRKRRMAETDPLGLLSTTLAPPPPIVIFRPPIITRIVRGGGRYRDLLIVNSLPLLLAGVTVKTASDSLSISTAEAAAVVVALSRADTPTLSISEAKTILALLARADTPSVSVSEAKTILASLSRTDAPSVAITESSAVSVVLTRADAVAVAISDVAQAMLVLLARTDAPTLSIGEAKTILATLARAETVSVSIIEIRLLLALLSRTDSPTLSISAAVALTRVLSAADAAAVAVGEARTLFAQLSRADALSLAVADQSKLTRLLQAADTLNVAISELMALMVGKSASDALLLQLIELAERLNLTISLHKRVKFIGSKKNARLTFRGERR